MVRESHERDYRLGGNTVFLTNALVKQPLHPFAEAKQ
jgi:hypothetical protein